MAGLQLRLVGLQIINFIWGVVETGRSAKSYLESGGSRLWRNAAVAVLARLKRNPVGSENTEGDMASIRQAEPEAASDWKACLWCVAVIAAGGGGRGDRNKSENALKLILIWYVG
jgi:hypothetical protein